ncbi:hypothetical protein TWF730_003992 [Orbilia blumenaviensis]|uniref:F-box domain-containing protein n=1 Tax=Orbilia blumenaviensis TaxID=1796055 RepID=A0AAV9U3Z6_9PEZI
MAPRSVPHTDTSALGQFSFGQFQYQPSGTRPPRTNPPKTKPPGTKPSKTNPPTSRGHSSGRDRGRGRGASSVGPARGRGASIINPVQSHDVNGIGSARGRGRGRAPLNSENAYTPGMWGTNFRSQKGDVCSISGPHPLMILCGLNQTIWDQVLSYLPLVDIKGFSLISRIARFLAVKHIFYYMGVYPPMIQHFKRGLSDLCQYIRHIKMEMTDIRWARHFIYESGWYTGVIKLEMFFTLHSCVEPNVIVASIRELASTAFYQQLVHLTLNYQQTERLPWGRENWYDELPEDQKGFLGDPITRDQAGPCLELIVVPSSLEQAVVNVAEGLDPDGIYFKFLSLAPKLKEIDIESWRSPVVAAIQMAEPMFPRLQKLRIGLQGASSLSMAVDIIVKHFPSLVTLQVDGFAGWWELALKDDIIPSNGLDSITKLKNLRTLVLPCPVVLGPLKPQMISVAAIYRLCPRELDTMLERWYRSGMELKCATFDGYFIHRSRGKACEYFELSCQLKIKLAVLWAHERRASQTNSPRIERACSLR